MKGKFKAKHPAKYIGDANNIIYRSSWEFHLMQWCDTNEEVAKWGSEEFSIPYRSPLDNRIHRYFPDFIIKKKNGEIVVIEIKPLFETQQPVKGNMTQRRFLSEVKKYAVNKAKWDAATYFCNERNWKFQILTEQQLYGK